MVCATIDGIQTTLAARSNKYFIIDGTKLEGSVSDKFIDSVKRNRHDVYGIRLGGSKIDEMSVALITESLLPQLPYMELYDASYLLMSNHSQVQLCRLLNPLVLGYCPILCLHLVNCGWEALFIFMCCLFNHPLSDRLGFKGGKLIFEALAPNVTMQELHLGGNNFSDSVTPFIVKYLGNADNTLKVLSIENNDITAEGNGSNR